MRISVKSLCEKLIWLLTVFLLASFLLFETKSWGRYALFGASALIVLLSAVVHDGVLRIRLQAFHIFMLLFTLFCGLSSMWAMNATDATNKMISLLQIFVCAAMLYIHYDQENDIAPLLSAVKWAGFVVALYSISFYGLDQMLESSQDLRLSREFANVNTIAMSAAFSCAFQWHDMMKKRSVWPTVFMIPAVILIAATQSRKAFVLLLGGIIAVYLMNTAEQKGTAKKVLKLLFYILVLYLGLNLLVRLPIFSGSLDRMEQMLNFWTEDGKADHSTRQRNDMIALGIEWFKKYPIAGIGIGNPHILTARYLKFDAYLHNNYVELLCGGGIIGFTLYYAMYVYLLYNLFKYRKADRNAFSLGLIWLVLMLIMNYGMVTYYSKTHWYYLLIHFVNVSILRKKHREMMANAQESAPQGN